MPSSYDEFSHRSYAEYIGGTERQRWHRDLLREVMEAEGFDVNPGEWWHFDYQDWREYGIQNEVFDEIETRR
jgi:D-alanyl-D-alanine dipeptidase